MSDPEKPDRKLAFADVPLPTTQRIKEDMDAKEAELRFDFQRMSYRTRQGAWEPMTPEVFWQEFRHTGEIRVSERIEDWVVGQDEPLRLLRLCTLRWIHKAEYQETLQGLEDEELASLLKESPGPYMLFVGPPGVGKSMIKKVAEEYSRPLYKEHDIKLYDVILQENPTDKNSPRVSYVAAGEGKKIVEAAKRITTPANVRDAIIRWFLWFLAITGSLMFATWLLAVTLFVDDPQIAWFVTNPQMQQNFLIPGIALLGLPLFILIITRLMANQGGGGLFSTDNSPLLAVDNSGGRMYIDATGSNAERLLGEIEWDPLGRSKPAHQRAKAGDAHKAHLKILTVDEFENWLQQPKLISQLRTILEEGRWPIQGQGSPLSSSGTASQMVKTPAIDCQFFLLACGNEDVLDMMKKSQAGEALRNRFQGYGKIVHMKTDMEDTPRNRMLMAMAVANECYRFRLNPVTRDAAMDIISFMRRKAPLRTKLAIRFRDLLGVLLGAGELSLDAEDTFIRSEHIRESMRLSMPIEEQKDLDQMEARNKVRIHTSGSRVGVVNGLYVTDGHVGGASPIAVHVEKVDDPKDGGFEYSGVLRGEQAQIQDSLRHVRTVLRKLYGIDVKEDRGDYYISISFVEGYINVEGPSAGAAMTLAIMSAIENKPVRQDMGVTGTVEIVSPEGVKDDALVGAVGGVYEKAVGAARWGLKMVICPKANFDHTLDPTVQGEGIRVIPASTIKECFALLTSEGG